MNKVVEKTLEIARRKIDAGGGQLPFYPRLGTGGGFADAFLWDTAFTCLWARYYMDELPVLHSLDNFYALQADGGLINRQYLPNGKPKWSEEHPISFAPPLLTWVENKLFESTGDASRLWKVYPHLVRHHQFLAERYRCNDGLYSGDALGCGMDNLARWPRDWNGEKGVVNPLNRKHVLQRDEEISEFLYELIEKDWCRWNEQGRFIDMSCQMAMDCQQLALMADHIGQDSRVWLREHNEIKAAINDACWSEEDGFYFDLGFGNQIKRYHIGAYWALLADIVPVERLTRFLEHLRNPARFGTKMPLPALSADDPDFNRRGGYWNGGVWAPTSYMVLSGLEFVGENALAKELAVRSYEGVVVVLEETGTIWENYSPTAHKPGQPAQPDFVGWSGLFSIAIPRQFGLI